MRIYANENLWKPVVTGLRRREWDVLSVFEEGERGRERHLSTKDRTEQLDGGIERTDELIDENANELYRLTDEEIEVVETGTAIRTAGTVPVLESPFELLYS